MRAGVNVKAVFLYMLLGNLDLCTWMVFGLEKKPLSLPSLDQPFLCVCLNFAALVSEPMCQQRCIIYNAHGKQTGYW